MAVETATYISDLNTANPTGTDLKSEGDNHLRLLKSTVKATFPNVTGAVTPTHTRLNYLVSAGGTTGTTSTNLVFSTSPTLTTATLAGTTDVSGGQLKFPAAQSASADANTLDDYEEGTFTPTLRFGGASVGITYTTQDGAYTKVGNTVHFRINVRLTAKGSSTGAATIAGLPFTVGGGAGVNAAASVAVFDLTGVTDGPMAYAGTGSTVFGLAYSNAGAGSNMTDANFQNNSWVIITGTYFV